MAKEGNSASLAEPASELEVSLYYVRTIARAAVEHYPDLVIGQLFSYNQGAYGPRILAVKNWFEQEKS